MLPQHLHVGLHIEISMFPKAKMEWLGETLGFVDGLNSKK